jgi:hypothetical protein
MFKSKLDRFANSTLSSKWKIPKDKSGIFFKINNKEEFIKFQ